jgi:hypothetical protein
MGIEQRVLGWAIEIAGGTSLGLQLDRTSGAIGSTVLSTGPRSLLPAARGFVMAAC